MKLRNKKTGEIKELPDGLFCGDNLKKICEEWEDVPEELKKYWYIDIDGGIMFDNVEDDTVKVMREIGNYFDTREEAEKALERLKKLQNLKNRGYNIDEYIDMIIERGEE